MKKAKPIRRTDADRLRSLVTAQARGVRRYTQKELAASLGVSTRTLRRFKNEPGHVLSEATRARIHKPLVKMETELRRTVKRLYGVPDTRIVQVPKETVLKSGSRSLTFEVSEWDTQAKIDFFASWAAKLKADKLDHFKLAGVDYFSNWNLKVKTTWKSAEKGEQFEEPDEDDDEEESPVRFYQTPPSAFTGITQPYIREFFTYHDDNYKNESGDFRGRAIESIYIYIPLKPKRSRKGKK